MLVSEYTSGATSLRNEFKTATVTGPLRWRRNIRSNRLIRWRLLCSTLARRRLKGGFVHDVIRGNRFDPRTAPIVACPVRR